MDRTVLSPPLLQVSGLSRKFGSVVVAEDVALSLEKGDILGVIGPNGAGKSSVFNLIAGSIQPDSGSVRLEGQEMVGLSASLRARAGIFRAFQIPQAFGHLTVYENILAAATFGRPRTRSEAEAAAVRAMELAGLAAKASVRAGSVPLLDRKRLELAKGLASSPKVLMLDEIGGGLTEREVGTLVELIGSIKQDYAILWIEHIAQALKAVADRILLLNFGKVLMEGPPEEVMGSAIVRSIYMGMPADA